MKKNMKKIVKTSALIITAFIATFIIFNNKNIKAAKADTQTVETTTYTICTGIQTIAEDVNATAVPAAMTLDTYRSLTNEAKQNAYKTFSTSFYQAEGQIQILKIGNTLQFYYIDIAHKKKLNFAYYGTYQKTMGEDRMALKLIGCMSAMQLKEDGTYQITQPTYKVEYDNIGMGIGSPGIIIDIPVNNIDVSLNNKDSTITFLQDPTPLSIYFDFINYNCIEVRFADFNILIYFGNTVWYNEDATKSDIKGKPIRGYRIEQEITATTQADNGTAYNQGYAQAIKDKEAYGETKYQAGYAEGVQSAGTYTFENLILSVIDVPISTLYGLLNFEILGTNIFSFVIALISIVVIVKIIQIVIGRL